MEEFEKSAFGMSKDDIREQYINSLTAHLSGLEMVVASILSDCQEELMMANPRVHRQLNIAKVILFEMMDEKRKETV